MPLDPCGQQAGLLTCHIPKPWPSPGGPLVCTSWQVKEGRAGRTCFLQDSLRVGQTSGIELSTLVVLGLLGSEELRQGWPVPGSPASLQGSALGIRYQRTHSPEGETGLRRCPEPSQAHPWDRVKGEPLLRKSHGAGLFVQRVARRCGRGQGGVGEGRAQHGAWSLALPQLLWPRQVRFPSWTISSQAPCDWHILRSVTGCLLETLLSLVVETKNAPRKVSSRERPRWGERGFLAHAPPGGAAPGE